MAGSAAAASSDVAGSRAAPLATALFFTTTGWFGGAERSMLELAVALQALGRPVHGLFPPGGDLARAWQAAGLKATPLTLPALGRNVLRNPAAALTGAAGTVRGLEQLAQQIAHHSAAAPAILHANSLSAAIHAALLVRLKPPPPPPAKTLAATLWHCRDLVDLMGFRAAVFPALTRVVAISTAVRQHLLQFGLPPEKCVLIKNGIALPSGSATSTGGATGEAAPATSATLRAAAQAAARKALGLDARTTTALHVSQFAPWKKTPLFLEACRAAATTPEKFPLQALLIGRDPVAAAEADADESAGATAAADAVPITIKAGLDRLRAAGCKVVHLPNADRALMEQAYAASDLLVHPAVGEPFGRVVLEAMARGVTVLARSQYGGGGGPAELVAHEQTGWLVARDDEFAPALIRLVSDPALRVTLAANARAEAHRADPATGEPVHSTARVAREIEALYRTLTLPASLSR